MRLVNPLAIGVAKPASGLSQPASHPGQAKRPRQAARRRRPPENHLRFATIRLTRSEPSQPRQDASKYEWTRREVGNGTRSPGVPLTADEFGLLVHCLNQHLEHPGDDDFDMALDVKRALRAKLDPLLFAEAAVIVVPDDWSGEE